MIVAPSTRPLPVLVNKNALVPESELIKDVDSSDQHLARYSDRHQATRIRKHIMRKQHHAHRLYRFQTKTPSATTTSCDGLPHRFVSGFKRQVKQRLAD